MHHSESRELHDLVRRGKVRHLGASSHAAGRLEEARGIAKARKLTPFCCVQERYTYLQPKPDCPRCPLECR